LNEKSQISVIAIDGPAASGKSTVGRLLAETLGYLFLDTGCMYRAVTLAALARELNLDDEAAVTRLTLELVIDILPFAGELDGRMYTVLVDGEDITWELRSPPVDAKVSLVSSYLGVREELVRQQRAYGRRGRVVMVGRDIGTVVMPNAPLKLYITASAEERARRRWEERRGQGHANSYEAILADVIRRDQFDSGRLHAPLRPAEDAILLDTTDHTPHSIVDIILGELSVRSEAER
jgi:cytidylate kinase